MYFSNDLAYLASETEPPKRFQSEDVFRLPMGHKICPVLKLQTGRTKADSGSPTDNCRQVYAVEFGMLRYVNPV